jgi:UPF0755 protein
MADEPNSGRRRRAFWLIGIVLAGLGLAAGGLWLDYRKTIDTPLNLPEPAVFEINKGDGLARIAEGLEARKIIRKPLWFKWLAYREGTAKRIKFGEYEIPPRITPRELLAMFAAGKVRQHPVTLVEGHTFRDILAELARHPALVATVAGKPPEEIMALLGAPDQKPEGLFFPDTYFVAKGTADLDVLKRAFRQMSAVLDREWPNRAEGLPLANPYEALILASIVEKETGRPEERPRIAGVFVRRLQSGMRLQTDPAVIYGLGESFAGNLRKDDLRRDTPYNTYTRSGLPPTPIALPGLAALRAALHPEAGASLYFVARGDGSHVFSTTLEEHQKAVDHYQKQRHD